MRLILPALIVVLAALSYFPRLIAPDLAVPPSVETAVHVALVLCGAWLVIDGARISGLQAKALAKANESDAEMSRLRDELARAQGAAIEASKATKEAKAAAALAGHVEAVNLLALLQQKGRFLDFVMDDVTRYPDAQIGAAARVVHQGCSSVVREYFEIKPVHDGAEGAPLTLSKDYDSHRYRLIGRVTGEPPFKGRVLHRGWLTAAVKLPERIDPKAGGNVIAPAEVELS
jgi:hypothetical protein